MSITIQLTERQVVALSVLIHRQNQDVDVLTEEGLKELEEAKRIIRAALPNQHISPAINALLYSDIVY